MKFIFLGIAIATVFSVVLFQQGGNSDTTIAPRAPVVVADAPPSPRVQEETSSPEHMIPAAIEKTTLSTGTKCINVIAARTQ